MSKYHKEYYKKNKERIKQYQKERYEAKKSESVEIEVKNKAVPNNGISSYDSSFFTINSSYCSSNNSNIATMNKLKGWIYTCSNINASSVASQKLRLYATIEEGGNNKFLHKYRELDKKKLEEIKSVSKGNQDVVEIVDHPLIDLLSNINDFNNSFESFELTSMYLDLIGDAYWWIKKDQYGVPNEIWVLQGQYMTIVPAKYKFIKGYLYGNNNDINSMVKFNNDEIIHFKTPNPNSLYYGLGSAQSVISAITRIDSMDISEQSRLNNMGRPDFVVGYKGGKLDTGDMKKIERMWNSAFGGPHKDGRIKVMDEDFDLKPLGFSPRDMEYLSGRVWSLKEIAGAFGIPYSMLDTSDTKKATSELADKWYAKQTILPRIKRIEEKLNEKLVPLFDPSGRLFVKYDNPVPEDRELILKENTEYVKAGIISVNEARARMGLDKLGEEYDKIPINTPSTPSTPINEREDEEDEEDEGNEDE